MDYPLEFFTNKRYELLKLLYDNQIKVKNSFYTSLSQQEIADIAHISKLKTNKIINELIEQKYLCLYNNKRGKYTLTEKGIKVINLISKEN